MNQVQLNAIQKYAHAQLQADKTGHGFDHIQRVVAISRQIATQEQANLFITLAAAYLHDVIDDKLVADPQAAQAHVRTFLSTTGLTPTERRTNHGNHYQYVFRQHFKQRHPLPIIRGPNCSRCGLA